MTGRVLQISGAAGTGQDVSREVRDDSGRGASQLPHPGGSPRPRSRAAGLTQAAGFTASPSYGGAPGPPRGQADHERGHQTKDH